MSIDIKKVLREIRDQALAVLKTNFIGDRKVLELNQQRLTVEVKA